MSLDAHSSSSFVGLYKTVVTCFFLYLVVALVARTPLRMLLVAKWFSTVWLGILSTLLSSFIGVLPFRMDLLRNNGKLGGGGSSAIAAEAR